jgi:murein DD-endopeptidase MepM/ murein hydrolase activator NlpD
MKEGLVVAVLRPAGAAICRLHFTRRHLVFGGMLLTLAFAGLLGLHAYELRCAADAVHRLAAERIEQQRKLDGLEAQTRVLLKQNAESERSIERIERTLEGRRAERPSQATSRHAAIAGAADPGIALSARLASLARASARTRAQALRLARLAQRVLNLRRLASIARARTLAAIPSLNPVSGQINAAFGWRTDPWPEFHKGLDLAADYGTTVRAAAAGTVASAGWEGSFGEKIDIDHGNGYHTWYCHLSRLKVTAGERVAKGQPIAAVGSTGESTGPHLHYQVMHAGVAIDPLPFLKGVPSNVLATLPSNADVP